jgi:hypothetical protein
MSKRLHIFLFCSFCLILFGCSPAKQLSPPIVPTITPIPDWHTLDNAGFQIWLPPGFVGGSNVNIDAIIQQLTEKDPGYAKVAQSLKQRGTPYIVFAVDTNSPADKVTYMLVGNEKLSAPLEIGAYLDQLSKILVAQYNQFKVIQKEVLPSDRYPTGKLVVELNTLESGDIKQVVYAVENGGAVWQISFTTPAEEYDKRSPIFEQIVRSATVPFTKEPASQTPTLDPGLVTLIGVALVIIGLLARRYQKQRQKAKPVPAQKIKRKARAKK